MKIVIFMKNWLGDILFQFPAVEMVRARYPEAEIICLAPSRCREILESHPAVNRVLVFDEKNEHRNIFARLGFGFALRAEKADLGILLHRSCTRAFLLWAVGIPERIGYARGRGFFLTCPVSEPGTPMHHAETFVEMLARAGYPRPAGVRYRFYVSARDREEAATLIEDHRLGRFACFHLGANWEPKRWPPEHFAKLAASLWKRWAITAVLTGGESDRLLAERTLAAASGVPVINLTGKTRLGGLAALFEKSIFVVTGDSGPMHIASGAGARVLALFGPTHPDISGPRGTGETAVLTFVPEGFVSPWYGQGLPETGWLSRITPEDVLRTIEERGWHKAGPMSSVGAEWLQTRKPPENSGSMKKILLVTLSNIGDVILTTPVLTALVSRYPQARLTVVVGPRAKGILEGSRQIDRLVVYDKKAGWLGQLRFLRSLREETYDLVVDLRHTAIPWLVSARRRSPLFRKETKIALRERHLEVLERMGLLSGPERRPFDFFSPAEEDSALKKMRAAGVSEERGWVVIAPAAASELKTWRLDGFRELIGRLLEEQKGDIVLAGDKREREIATPLVSADPSRVKNLAGLTTLRELAALISRASLVVANDSAVMHLAAELGRPVVAIFGPTSAERYAQPGPRFKVVKEALACVPCGKPVCVLPERICLDRLPSSKVFEACRELLHADSL
ncbi:MAG: glycosyltransferase family 9 protein [Candidatus Omnitrophota bacterium]|jgi:lipopolysaccharide heptosyltransferase II